MCLGGFLLGIAATYSSLSGAEPEHGPAELRLQAGSQADPDFFSTDAQRITFVVLGVLVVSIIGIGVWSSTDSRRAAGLIGLSTGPSAKNLFLGVKYNDDDSREAMGYFRSLDLREASFVSNRYYTRGQSLDFNLRSLPGFEGAASRVGGLVTSCRSIGGSPESYLVHVRFEALSDLTKTSLTEYLSSLTRRSTAYSRA